MGTFGKNGVNKGCMRRLSPDKIQGAFMDKKMKVNDEFSHNMVAMVHFLVIYHNEGLEPEELVYFDPQSQQRGKIHFSIVDVGCT